ncbi:hypothetical protein [Blastopirellula retiformator]|uniref:Uncharacterized protein n=1 Tax=Blastopirellula retiformator TaxID=2527970 RepID=A0A5C5V3R8_9BACT|nr:hypothetical protein [Blastopirellula retiformator]TWT33216.1 hypothetical protein Enr8_30410 [Blastopirellula retiformator]
MSETPNSAEPIESSPTPPRRNLIATVGKIALYSFLALSCGTLFAAQYVPEVATALSLILPEEEPHSCSSLQRGSCCLATAYPEPSCCPSSGGCPAAREEPSEMIIAAVELQLAAELQVATVEQPPIPPVVD